MKEARISDIRFETDQLLGLVCKGTITEGRETYKDVIITPQAKKILIGTMITLMFSDNKTLRIYCADDEVESLMRECKQHGGCIGFSDWESEAFSIAKREIVKKKVN